MKSFPPYPSFILLLGAFIFNFQETKGQYCVSNLYTIGCIYGDYIDDVSMSSISQTNTGCGTDGYSDYTSDTVPFEQGSAYNLFISVGNYGEYASLWIDYNDDYTLADSEKVISDLFCNNAFTLYSVNFTIPELASLGDHRMRLRIAQYTSPIDACSDYYYGEVHDYTAEVGPPTDMSYASSTATQTESDTVSLGSTDVNIIGVEVETYGSLNPLTLNSFTLNSNGTTSFTDDVTNVKVYYSGNDPAFSTNNLFGSATDLTSPITGSQELLQGINYFWVAYDVNPNAPLGDYLDAECTAITIGGDSYTPTITTPSGNVQTGYCIPTDQYACYFAYIDGVVLNTLHNTLTYCNGMANGYIHYDPTDDLTTSLEQGGNYSITLTGSAYAVEGLAVWIDLNNDGDFDDANEFVCSTDTGTGSHIESIAIPMTTSAGDHQMRVRCNYYHTLSADQSCTTFYYGETEDYTITIVPFQCSSDFALYPDSLIPHHYWAINSANGIPPISYSWSWGDGTFDSIAYPSHTYDTAGWYTICLHIVDSTGCSDSYCADYEILKSESPNTMITVDVVDSLPGIPTTVEQVSLLQSWSVFPNPATEDVFVNYSLTSPAKVNIDLFDVIGNKLLPLINADHEAGQYHSKFDSRKLPNGIYFLQIRAGDEVVTTKIVAQN